MRASSSATADNGDGALAGDGEAGPVEGNETGEFGGIPGRGHLHGRVPCEPSQHVITRGSIARGARTLLPGTPCDAHQTMAKTASVSGDPS